MRWFAFCSLWFGYCFSGPTRWLGGSIPGFTFMDQTSSQADSREIVVASPAPAAAGPPVAGQAPSRQLSELPKDELVHLAEGLGVDPTEYKTQQALVSALHDRRQLIASLDREAMLDVVRWGRRPVTINAAKEQIAQEIARIRSMKFGGLSHRGLVVLAQLRGANVTEADPTPVVARKLKKQEGFFSRLNRKRRAVLGGMVASMVGEREAADYRYLPEPGNEGQATVGSAKSASIKEEIEESGLFGGISNRLKKSADVYLNEKLDEIEARIDRKLDEIDRRLAEWRDKEIANRIKILKITLWASVIVGVVSLIYAYVTTYLIPH
jgi:hypothetical protein